MKFIRLFYSYTWRYFFTLSQAGFIGKLKIKCHIHFSWHDRLENLPFNILQVKTVCYFLCVQKQQLAHYGPGWPPIFANVLLEQSRHAHSLIYFL